jgi:hypothetical protein
MKAAFGLRADFFFAVFFATTVSSGRRGKASPGEYHETRFSLWELGIWRSGEWRK